MPLAALFVMLTALALATLQQHHQHAYSQQKTVDYFAEFQFWQHAAVWYFREYKNWPAELNDIRTALNTSIPVPSFIEGRHNGAFFEFTLSGLSAQQGEKITTLMGKYAKQFSDGQLRILLEESLDDNLAVSYVVRQGLAQTPLFTAIDANQQQLSRIGAINGNRMQLVGLKATILHTDEAEVKVAQSLELEALTISIDQRSLRGLIDQTNQLYLQLSVCLNVTQVCRGTSAF